MIPTLAFTGPERLLPVQEAFCRAELRRLRSGTDGLSTWRSGGAHGLDTLVVEESGVHQDVALFVPADPDLRWNRDLLTTYDFFSVQYCGGGYRGRNEDLVSGADHLHAFVRGPVFYRSGEWMTINVARRLGVPTTLHVIPL